MRELVLAVFVLSYGCTTEVETGTLEEGLLFDDWECEPECYEEDAGEPDGGEPEDAGIPDGGECVATKNQNFWTFPISQGGRAGAPGYVGLFGGSTSFNALSLSGAYNISTLSPAASNEEVVLSTTRQENWALDEIDRMVGRTRLGDITKEWGLYLHNCRGGTLGTLDADNTSFTSLPDRSYRDPLGNQINETGRVRADFGFEVGVSCDLVQWETPIFNDSTTTFTMAGGLDFALGGTGSATAGLQSVNGAPPVMTQMDNAFDLDAGGHLEVRALTQWSENLAIEVNYCESFGFTDAQRGRSLGLYFSFRF